MIDFSNFFIGTVANWSLCEIPNRAPDYISFVGSAYWNFGDRVRRWSNHWGVINSCRWYLDFYLFNGLACGECYYEDFRWELTDGN